MSRFTEYDLQDGAIGLSSRKAAISAFTGILEGRSLSEALPQAVEDLEPRDAAFTHALVHAACKNYHKHKGVLATMMDKPQRKRLVQSMLHLGLTELYALATPDHAAVHGYVEIAKQSRGLAPYKNLINALLRRAGRERETVRSMSVMVHLPQWMQTSWIKAYGEETVSASIAQMLVEPSLDIALKAPSPEAAEQLLSFREGYAPYPAMVRLASAQGVNLMPGFEAGDWWVQDISAQMPVLLFGDVTGKTVADFCAAPGGKTMQLAARGAHVTAIDISQDRLSRVHENLARTGLTADVQVQDLAKSKLEQSFDAVLLDAPCSATGTLRRNPDVTMHRRPEDIPQLQALQRKLLQTAVEALKPGGTLVYSVCSLEPEEGEAQAQWLLNTFPNMQAQPIEPEQLPLLSEGINSQGQLRLLPHMLQGPTPRLSGVDGFFAARFTKA